VTEHWLSSTVLPVYQVFTLHISVISVRQGANCSALLVLPSSLLTSWCACSLQLSQDWTLWFMTVTLRLPATSIVQDWCLAYCWKAVTFSQPSVNRTAIFIFHSQGSTQSTCVYREATKHRCDWGIPSATGVSNLRGAISADLLEERERVAHVQHRPSEVSLSRIISPCVTSLTIYPVTPMKT